MEYTRSLLFASLIQVTGVTSKQEQKYWGEKIYTLQDLAHSIEEQMSLFSKDRVQEINQLIDDAGSSIDIIAKKFEEKSRKKDFYRIAYSIPEKVMFLDIETTGLSPIYHYVTVVGWMINGKYGCWLVGTDPTEFISALKNAKMLVTFNGTRFDCRFLDAVFPELKIKEKPNLDLMHFCRKYGLIHGQKNIEHMLNFKRPDNVLDCNGKEAVALWYKFIFGDDEALQLLIEYNFYDVLGMTYILDSVFFQKIYGKIFPKIGYVKNFYNSKRKCHIHYSKRSLEQVRKLINAKSFNLRLLKESFNKRIVGIDLAGVVKNSSKTGACLLIGDQASTQVLKSDEEIMAYIIEARADIVSIDAPLSLPKGRTTVYNDDPMREKAGIMRYSERVLHSRGVNSYPALIDSMQELTKRGIALSHQLRKLGYPVIECFPGAAQDILQLPRKRTDKDLLKTGLIRLGIHGDFEQKKVVHDELDAITAAIVGKFFIDGYYEPIGIPEENDMIVPSRTRREMPFNIIIGITGHIAAGKTTIAKYISEKGFTYCRYSQIIATLLENQDIEVNRGNLQLMGSQLFDSSEQYHLNQEVEKFLVGNSCAVIDGMRHYEDYTYWKEKNFSNFYLLYVDTSETTCAMRYDGGSYQKDDHHYAEKEIDRLRVYADLVVNNDGTIDELYNKIDDFLGFLDHQKVDVD